MLKAVGPMPTNLTQPLIAQKRVRRNSTMHTGENLRSLLYLRAARCCCIPDAVAVKRIGFTAICWVSYQLHTEVNTG
jgi:hypothetical protein